MQTITPQELKAAFATAIMGIEPTLVDTRGAPWVYEISQRVDGRVVFEPPYSIRHFDLVMRNARQTDNFTGGAGVSYTCTMAVVTCYPGVAWELLDWLKVQDGADIHRVLLQLRDPTLPGMVDVIHEGTANEVGSDTNLTVEHVYSVVWHMAV